MNQPSAYATLFANAFRPAVFFLIGLIVANSSSMAQVTDDLIAPGPAVAEGPESILDSNPGPLLEAPDASGSADAIESGPPSVDDESSNGLEDFQVLEAPGFNVEPFDDVGIPLNVPSVIAPPTSSGSSTSKSARGPYLGALGRIVPGWGFVIKAVVPDSAAARMQLEPGDVILSINGRRATSMKRIYWELSRSSSEFGGKGLVYIDNVRGRQQRCGYRGTLSGQERFLLLKFTL